MVKTGMRVCVRLGMPYLRVKYVDGEGPSGNGEDWDVAEEVAELLRVHRGGSDDEFEILASTHHVAEKAEQHVGV